MKKTLCLVLTVMIVAFSLSGCSGTSVQPVSKTEIYLGTVCKITIYDKPQDKIFNECFKKLKEIDDSMSINKTGTELDKINSAAGISTVKADSDVYNVIKSGVKYGDISGGKFDITIGTITTLWNIGTDKARVPEPSEIKSGLSLVNYKNIILNDSTKEVMLKNKGMIVDLGGIAKGYAADELSKILKKDGVKRAMIDLGGDILPVGRKADGSDWGIGIQDPNSTRGDILGEVRVGEKAVVTSGIYERYFEKNGKRYHHIMDTSTGYPIDNELASVSIITNNSTDGDGLSTTVFAFGVNDGMKLYNRLKNFEAVFVTKNKEVYITPGLKDKFIITNSSYKLKN